MATRLFCPQCGATRGMADASGRFCVSCGGPVQPAPASLQFSMKSLFVVFTAITVLFGIGASLGAGAFAVSSAIAGFAIAYYGQVRSRILFVVGVTMISLALFGFCLIGMRCPPRSAFIRVQCQSNLHQIALAMHQYHDRYGTLPPAYFADETGKPMHSWRVLLLPFLEHQPLYRQYDFSEPWDGPNNRRLAKDMPEVFACATDKRRGNLMTSYVLVTGKETVFNADQSMSLDQLAAMDGTSATLLVAECAESGIHWMEPRDLPHDQMSFQINDRNGKKSIRSYHLDGVNVAMADTAARFVPARADKKAFRAILTADGGEKESPF